MILLQLFYSFFKIGLFTIGGGYAMLAIIQQEIVRYGWLTRAEFVDIVSIAEMTPGPIAVNAATFVSYRSAGLAGALAATTAVVLPSLISVMVVAKAWERYKSSQAVQGMFGGIRPVVVGLVGAAAVLVATTSLETLTGLGVKVGTLLIAAGSFGAVYYLKWDPIKVLLGAGLLGLLLF